TFAYRIPMRWKALLWFDEAMIVRTTSPATRFAGKLFMAISYALMVVGLVHAWRSKYRFVIFLVVVEFAWLLFFYSFFFGQHRYRSWLHPTYALLTGLGAEGFVALAWSHFGGWISKLTGVSDWPRGSSA